MSESKRKGKDLLEYLRDTGKDGYGTVTPGEEVRQVIGLEFPPVADKQTYDQLALLELNAVDYARNVLLGEGKYFGQSKGDYRVFLPSENANQIRRYMEHADAKLKRGLKLSRNSPMESGPCSNDNLSARILMKREGIKSRTVLGKKPDE